MISSDWEATLRGTRASLLDAEKVFNAARDRLEMLRVGGAAQLLVEEAQHEVRVAKMNVEIWQDALARVLRGPS